MIYFVVMETRIDPKVYSGLESKDKKANDNNWENM